MYPWTRLISQLEEVVLVAGNSSASGRVFADQPADSPEFVDLWNLKLQGSKSRRMEQQSAETRRLSV